jgi:outer membrane receptor protein involved in Fe transport
MKRLAAQSALLILLISQPALAAKTYLMLFLDDAPVQGAIVDLDGVEIGRTDIRGSASADIQSGNHVLTLVDAGIRFPVEFSAGADQDVEISVTFASAVGVAPKVNIQKFGPGEPGTGYITGQVSSSDGDRLVGASITLVGTDYSTIAAASGIYALEVPRGAYSIRISAPDYNGVTINGVRVMSGLGVSIGVNLQPRSEYVGSVNAVIEEVFVLGVFNPQEDSASVERYATSITNAIDVAQLERFGDSDVAGALNRVVGVAVTESKYATVRGLDGRYISATLNGLLMPSTDPQRRDVQLDLFPTDILGGIEIQKSYTPDQLATTTGGSIKIMTKGLPDETIRKISGGLAYNLDFTGDAITKYRGSNYDWAGYDSGLRDLPNGVLAATDGGRSLTICDPAIDPVRCTAPIDAARLGVRFEDDYNVGEKDALPDGDLSIALGDRLAAGDNEWGYYLAGTYDRSTSDRGTAQLTNPLDTTGSYTRSRETTDMTGYLALGYEYGDDSEVLSKTTVLRSADDTTRVESGVDGAEGNQIDRTILEWVERQFISQAFVGHNEIAADWGSHEVDWRAAYSRTDRDEPDRRQYSYFNGNLSTSAFERRWSDLEETSVDLALDYALNWDWGSVSTTAFKVGVLWSDKERSVEQYRFGIRLGDNGQDLDLGIDQDLEEDILPYQNFALDKVRLAANTASTDSYDSQEEVQAFYLTSNTDFGEAWTLLAGARFEDFSQELTYPNDPNAISELTYDDWYPALNLSWRPTEALQLRLGYSETVSYPGLIERSEAQSFDPDTDDPIFGNPNLQISTIDNIDLRAEYYFSDSESISLALFAKEITNPVERAIPDASGSAAGGTTFVNQEKADLLGVEMDANKTLIDEDEYLLFIGGNIAYIDSEVDLSADSIRLEGAAADGRQLQGQSEWLANVQLGFDHYPSEQKITLLLNYFDDRIFRISRGAATGAEIEVERIVIDVTYEKEFSESLTVKASIKNLLNEDVEFSQNGRTIESFQTGTLLGVSLSYRF